MSTSFSHKAALSLCVIIGFSLAGGFVNGLLGTGGGIILTYMYASLGKGRDSDIKDSLASSMATVLPISLFSLSGYPAEVMGPGSYLLGIVTASALGGIGGALISSRLKSEVLVKIFSALVIYAGANMLF